MMIQSIFEQLSNALVHLGEKQIATLHLWGIQIQFDLVTIMMSWIVMAILIALALLFRRSLKQPVSDRPNRTQASLVILIELLQGQLSASFSSDRLAVSMFPFVSTLFLFVLVSNWLGVIPHLSSPTQDLNVTLGLALMVFVVSQVLAARAKGFKRYLKSFLEPIPALLPLNILGELSRPMSHAFRLFGNILAGTILIAIVTAFAPLVVPPALNIVFGLFFGTIQAFVFAILAVAYINVAVEE